MHTKKLAKAEWKAYFDRMSKSLGGRMAEIEVASLNLGHQVEANWVPLIGIVYDPKDDIVEIAVDQLDHMIQKPREIVVEEGPDGLASVEITDSDGIIQIVKLKSPMMLPPPSKTKYTVLWRNLPRPGRSRLAARARPERQRSPILPGSVVRSAWP